MYTGHRTLIQLRYLQVSFSEQSCHHVLHVSRRYKPWQFQLGVKEPYPFLSYSIIYTREVLENALDSTVTGYGDLSNRVTTSTTY